MFFFFLSQMSHKARRASPKFAKLSLISLGLLTLKFKAQPTNAFFATEMFGRSSQLPTAAEHAVIK